ncbi:hypothetical protein [Knoellia subterranea]|uniref:DUF559 domain-containing protein n=1 Tax=Knoellia subterranea KCTC 19937 TaxID=1385521 RepID=A0A0A0JQ80_9MICO|nr:hypothetical protein [Knoellia subterranea]KGN39328.1 hypothetical protein N803_02350 [Knoellia subterranea KCTC 19937]
MPQPRLRLSRHEREVRARGIAADQGGVAHRKQLREVGITRADIRTEITAGRWHVLGKHTVGIGSAAPTGEALWWQAVWESGAGAALDGAVALCAAGLKGFTPWRIDVTIRHANRHHQLEGMRLHRVVALPPLAGGGLPRVCVENAAIRAACWTRTDREAALVLCLVVPQRLTSPQVVRHGNGGRVYLDAGWEDIGLFVEIDGGHHQWALNPVDDALRQNDLVAAGEHVLRVPVLGLRLAQDRFMAQVVMAHERLTLQAAS